MEALSCYCSSDSGASEAPGSSGQGDVEGAGGAGEEGVSDSSNSSDSDGDGGAGGGTIASGRRSLGSVSRLVRGAWAEAVPTELPTEVPVVASTLDPRVGRYPSYVHIPVRMPVGAAPYVRSCLSQLKKRIPSLQRVLQVGASLTQQDSNSRKRARDGERGVGHEGAKGGEGAAAPPWSLDDAALLATEYHVSLSRPVLVNYGEIEGLVSELRGRLCARMPGPPRMLPPASAPAAALQFGGWKVFANDDRTKTFVSLAVRGEPSRRLVLQGIRATNEAFFPLGLATFYRDPDPHLSLAWAPGDIREELTVALAELPSGADGEDGEDGGWWRSPLQRVVCLVGNRFLEVWTAEDETSRHGAP